MSYTNLNDLFDDLTSDVLTNGSLIYSLNKLKAYDGTDWKQYISKINSGYAKILVNRNEEIEMFVITWSPFSETKIHDHPSKGCIMRVIDGELTEYVYKNEVNHVNLFENKKIFKGHGGYRCGNKILHKIKNEQLQNTYSIHIYSKPNFVYQFYD